MTAVQQDIDWYKVNTDEFTIETKFHMHLCKQEDFGTDEQSIKLFKSWTGYMIMCPELVNDEGQELKFNGAKGMMRTSSVTFRVERCSNADYCASDDEIDEYIKDVHA